MLRLLCFSTFCLLAANGVADSAKDDAAYADLVKRATAGALSIDFSALRFGCLKASSCDLLGDNKDLIAARKAMQAKEYENAAKIADALIARGFPNIEAHVMAADAYAGLNEKDRSQFHRDVAAGLIQSILHSGDGKTKETAFVVAAVHEEYIIMMVLGLPPLGSQSLIAGKPHSYDMLEREDPKTGTKVQVYFLIDAFFPMKGL